MQQPLQPQFKIRVYPTGSYPGTGDTFSKKGNRYDAATFDTFMDIETCVSYGVTYSEEASMINRLSFTVDKHADILLQRFYIGMWVVLYGGYYSQDGSGVRKIFSGTITRINASFPDNGAIKFSVECLGYGFNQMGKDTFKNYVYPDKNSERSFVKGKSSISLANLVRGIAETNNLLVGEISLPKESSTVEFTERKPRYQKNMSDWAFLLHLATSYGCSLWTENRDGKEYIYFVDINKAANTINDQISFVYPLKSERIPNAAKASPVDRSVTSLLGSEIQSFPDSTWNRPRILRDVTVTEDIAQATAVVRTSVNIDMSTGDAKETISEIRNEDGKQVIYQYELDEARVEYIHRTNPELADRIRSQGATSMEWRSNSSAKEETDPRYAAYYYKQTKIVDAEVAVFDRAFFGIEIEATCNMDLDIRSQRSYSIRGISRYNSSNNTGRYFLRGLKHVWDSDGTHTELSFIR